MKRGFKFMSRLIVGLALIILSGVIIYNIFNTIVIPKLPVKKGGEFLVDVSGSMKEPDKTYARNAIEKAARDNKIVVILDYQLTSFEITDSYLDKVINNCVNSIYRNQKYVVYTYFKDTNTLNISTNINDTANDVVSKKKENIDTDAKVVKEILYFQQNLKPEYGLSNWNFNLNTESMRNVSIGAVGSIILFILGIGVLPTAGEGLRNPFRRHHKKAPDHE